MSCKILLSASLLILAVTVSGCMTPAGGKHVPAPITPTERYSMHAEQRPEQMAFGVHPDGLSDNQRSALTRYVDGWMSNGGGAIAISTPKSGDAAAARTAWAIKARLQQLGVADGDVQVQSYESDTAGAPVLVVYSRYAAVVPKCNQSWTDLTNNYKNDGYQNFGCATTANMAAMVANPRDIVTPADAVSGDAGRRAVIMDKYRKGEPTGAVGADANAGKAATSVVN
ncbi:MAG TPA: CpaD family pilus assembly protein [Caulobacteraceae bacterium]|jgi:pilus assembly protein CpaD|nr:CpaD family pilus assembly protein [Caulobacteraceae bacterium]